MTFQIFKKTPQNSLTNESKLEQELDFEKRLLNAIDQAIIATDISGLITFWSPSAEKLYGWKKDEVMGKNITEITPSDLSIDQAKFIMESLKQGGTWKGEFNVKKKDGTSFLAYVIDTPVLDENGVLTGIIGISTDITEKKKIEDQLVISEEKFRSLTQNIPDVVWTADEQGHTTFISDRVFDLLGYTPEEFKEDKNLWFDSVHPEDLQKMDTAYKLLYFENKPFLAEYRIKTKDGRWIWVLDRGVKVYTVNNVKYADGVVTDITARKEAEFKLQNSEKKYRQLFETMAEGVVYQDKDGKIISANITAQEILGLTMDQMQGKTSMDPEWACVHEDGSPYPGETHPAMIALKSGKRSSSVMGVYHPIEKSYRWIIVNSVPEFDEKKEVFRVFTTFEDITNRKQDEEVIRRDKATDEAILHSIGDGLVVTDKEGNVLLVNEAFTELTGFIESDVLGKNMASIVKKEDEAGKEVPFEERILNKVLAGEKIILDITSSYYFVKKDGSRFPITLAVSPIVLDGKIIGAVETFRDITREKEIDKAKSEFVSLASHQLRTPLSTINWYVETLLTPTLGPTTQGQQDYLKEVYIASKRMVELVNALLNVSRVELGTFMVEPKPTDFRTVADEVLKDIDHQIQEKKQVVEKKYDSSLPLIPADPKLLRIIFQNLITNSVKYTPENGKITIDIKAENENVLIKITDTGCGIPKSQEGQIFTKLFRADNVRELETDGTGLGLYIAKAIVDQSKGKIWFETIENQGTTFFVQLPISGMLVKKGYKALD